MTALGYRLLADLTLLLHVAFVLFVVLGLVLTLIGGLLGWAWVRGPKFRALHLAAIGIVVLQAWLGIICPLTTVENWLRSLAGQTTYPGSFISYWLRAALYYQAPPWTFTAVYSGFGALVLATWIWVRPHFVSRGPTAPAKRRKLPESPPFC